MKLRLNDRTSIREVRARSECRVVDQSGLRVSDGRVSFGRTPVEPGVDFKHFEALLRGFSRYLHYLEFVVVGQQGIDWRLVCIRARKLILVRCLCVLEIVIVLRHDAGLFAQDFLSIRSKLCLGLSLSN